MLIFKFEDFFNFRDGILKTILAIWFICRFPLGDRLSRWPPGCIQGIGRSLSLVCFSLLRNDLIFWYYGVSNSLLLVSENSLKKFAKVLLQNQKLFPSMKIMLI